MKKRGKMSKKDANDDGVRSLFLMTGVYDEGVDETSFKLYRARSRVHIVEVLLERMQQEQNEMEMDMGLRHSMEEWGMDPAQVNAEQVLQRIDESYVDGDSSMQIRIFQIAENDIENL